MAFVKKDLFLPAGQHVAVWITGTYGREKRQYGRVG